MAESKPKDDASAPIVRLPAGDPPGEARPLPAVPAEEAPEPEPLPDAVPKGKVRLSTTGPVSHVHVDDVTITARGADVDPETAQRAHEAAALAGFTLREETTAKSVS